MRRHLALLSLVGGLGLPFALETIAQGAWGPYSWPGPAASPPVEMVQASPGVEPAPVKPLPGQLNLTEDQRRRLREAVELTGPRPQPVPRAFAPAVGMTSPPELELAPLPEPARTVPGLGENHRYAMLDNGMLMVIGDNRLVVALIGPAGSGNSGSGVSRPGR